MAREILSLLFFLMFLAVSIALVNNLNMPTNYKFVAYVGIATLLAFFFVSTIDVI
jgi:hypothetical protein